MLSGLVSATEMSFCFADQASLTCLTAKRVRNPTVREGYLDAAYFAAEGAALSYGRATDTLRTAGSSSLTAKSKGT